MEGISTAADLDERLRAIRDVPGGEEAFAVEALALGRDLAVRIGSDSMLRIALAGLARDGAGGREDAVADPPLSVDQVVRSAEVLAGGSAGWAARHRGLLDPLAAGGVGERPWLMSGRAIRWLIDRDVPVGPLRLGRIDEYVKSVIEMLDRGEGTEPLGAHLNVVVGQAEDGDHLPLAEELALLAWLLDVYDEYVDLEALLVIRGQGLRGELA